MLRVGYDIRPALIGNAGIARYARELASELTKLPDGPILELFAPNWRRGRPRTHSLEPGRFKMHRGPLPARVMHFLNRMPGLDAGRWPAKVDVFHWTDYIYPTVRTAAKVMTLHDAAFAVDPTFHGWNTSVLLDRVRGVLPTADIVIVVSEPGRWDAELIGADPDQIRVVPNGVSPIFRPADSTPARSGYLLTVGTLEPRKNFTRVLQALERLWEKDAAPDWYIVGREGWDFEEFVGRMRSSKYHERIHWVPNADDDKLVELYQGCIALVYASLHEGFGLPVLEAMACGKAVVVSDRTAPAWVAGKGGMRVHPRKVDSIQEGIERILTEHSWRRQAAAVNLHRAQEFSWKTAAEKTLLAYRDAITRHKEQGARSAA